MTEPEVEDLPFEPDPMPLPAPAPAVEVRPPFDPAAWRVGVDPFPVDDADSLALEGYLDSLDAAARRRAEDPWALLIAARWYVASGIPVFPIVPREKRPATKHGFEDATTDPAWIEHWWARENPQYNIGIPTGGRFDVIDVDGPTGFRTYVKMLADGAVPPILAKAWTPGTNARPGGLHVYIAPTGDGNGAKVAPGIDYRGRGGYVLAAPSVSENGRRYTWAGAPPGAGA